MLKNNPKEPVSTNSKQTISKTYLEPHKQPMVFLFDVEKTVVEKLKELRFNVFEGSLGHKIKVDNRNYEQKLIKLNNDYPANLHEFDIVVLDLTGNKCQDYDPNQHQLKNTSGSTAHVLLSAYPEQVFDPRPLTINIVARNLDDLFEKKSVIIVFCKSEQISEYHFAEITHLGINVTSKERMSSFSFYRKLPSHKSRNGKKIKLPEKASKLSPLFIKHIDNIEFGTTFDHPTVWRDNKYHLTDDFFPLLLNERDEIISYAHFIKESIVFVFPDIADKPVFISELFKSYLPEITPKIFPFHGEFQWLDAGDYPLPGETQLLQDRAIIEKKYSKDIAENQKALASLKDKYKFLYDLISETGGALVSAVEKYLKWLDFESVINLDDTNPDTLEEDIQVDYGDRFLVIEIKGIGGTSTDKDCSQISKIKYRRAEARGKFDVFGLYIVNHQRYLPPKSRSNPPFTENQIRDAVHDKRGLLTTYTLYKAYFLIEAGILHKAGVRESLFKTGLITLDPENISSIGTPDELFMDGRVAIIKLNNTNLTVGDTLIVRKKDDYSQAIIESIQVDGQAVDTCNTGEIGIKLDRKLQNNSELFVKKV